MYTNLKLLCQQKLIRHKKQEIQCLTLTTDILIPELNITT